MDYRLEQWINGPAGHHATVDRLMVHAASWGEAIFITLVVGWFLIGWLGGRPTERHGALAAFIAADLGLLINLAIGQVWARPRPFAAHPGTVHVLLNHSTDGSFPSDHAVAAFAIAVVLVTRHWKLGSLALIFAALMSYARVYVGDHYPGDVLAGAGLGILVGIVLNTWLQPGVAWLGQILERGMRALHLPMPVERSRQSLVAHVQGEDVVS